MFCPQATTCERACRSRATRMGWPDDPSCGTHGAARPSWDDARHGGHDATRRGIRPSPPPGADAREGVDRARGGLRSHRRRARAVQTPGGGCPGPDPVHRPRCRDRGPPAGARTGQRRSWTSRGGRRRAGVRKSRLFWEFAHSDRLPRAKPRAAPSDAGAAAGWLVLATSAASYGKATPYPPVNDLLRAHFPDREPRRRPEHPGKGDGQAPGAGSGAGAHSPDVPRVGELGRGAPCRVRRRCPAVLRAARRLPAFTAHAAGPAGEGGPTPPAPQSEEIPF